MDFIISALKYCVLFSLSVLFLTFFGAWVTQYYKRRGFWKPVATAFLSLIVFYIIYLITGNEQV